MTRSNERDTVPMPSAHDLERISALQAKIGGPGVRWSAEHFLNVLLAEHRVRADRLASERIERATWALAAATLVLAVATVGLIVATLSN